MRSRARSRAPSLARPLARALARSLARPLAHARARRSRPPPHPPHTHTTNQKKKTAFRAVGSVNAAHPALVAVGVTCLLLAGAVAFFLLRDERLVTDVNDLWAPTDSRAVDDEARLVGAFGTYARYATAMVTASPTVLSELVLAPLIAFESEVASMAVEHGDSEYVYSDICERAFDGDGAPCVALSVTDFWHRDAERLKASADSNALAEDASKRGARSAAGLQVRREAVLGLIRLEGESESDFGPGSDPPQPPPPTSSDSVHLARACTTAFMLTADPALRGAVEAWEAAFVERAAAFADAVADGFSVTYAATSSAGEEITRAGESAVPLAAVGLVLIGVLLFFFLAKSDPVDSRSWLAPMCLAWIALSCASGIGVALLMHADYTSITVVVLFLVLGVGVDDIVLLVSIADEVPAALSPAERAVKTMEQAGAFVTVTTASTVLAFLAGIPSAFPAVSSFCLGAAFVMGINFMMVCTAFSALTVLDDRRRNAFLLPFRGCMPAKTTEKAKREKRKRDELVFHIKFTSAVEDMAHILLNDNRYRFGVLVLFFLVLPALAAWMVTHMQTGLNTQLVLPDGSYLTDFLDAKEVNFPSQGPRLDVAFWAAPGGGAIDFGSPEALLEIEALTASLEALDSTAPPTASVFRAFEASRAASADELTLEDFIASAQGIPYRDSVVLGSDGRVAQARVSMQHVVIADSNDKTKAMEDARAVVDAFERASTPTSAIADVSAFSPDYVLWESYALQVSEMLVSMGLSLAVVFAVLCLFMHAGVAVLLAVQIVIIDVCILGYMVFIHLKLHSVTTVCLIMAVGVAVDFGAHTAHGWLHDAGTTRIEKSVNCTAKLAMGLTTGALSTFLGVLPLAFAKVATSRIFFQMMAGVLLAGWGYGVVALPVVLSFIGPMEPHHGEEDGDGPKAEVFTDPTRAEDPPALPGPPLDGPDPVYGLENLAFEGGGAKGVAYLGVAPELERAGVLKYIKRCSGTSAGSVTALGFALGLSTEQGEAAFNVDASKFLFDTPSGDIVNGKARASLALARRQGMNEGHGYRELIRDALRKHTGNPDLTFKQLFDVTGRELCIVGSNLSQQSADYFHMKTTPNMPIADAVRISVSLPVLCAPSVYKGCTYVDGGLVDNYPVAAFDGWWLSMDPKDSFLYRLGSFAASSGSIQAALAGRFGTSSECNLRTLGFKTFAADDSSDIAISWLAPGGEAPPPPDTELARSKAEESAKIVKALEKRRAVSDAFTTLLAAAKASDADGNVLLDKAEWLALCREVNKEDLALLFDGETDPKLLFAKLDADGSGEIDFAEIACAVESTGLDVGSLLSGIDPSSVDSAGEMMASLVDTLSTNVSRLQMKELDCLRTVPINAGHVGTVDMTLDPADEDWLKESARRATRAWLFRRRRSSLNFLMTKWVRRVRAQIKAGHPARGRMARAMVRGELKAVKRMADAERQRRNATGSGSLAKLEAIEARIDAKLAQLASMGRVVGS